MEAIQSNPTSGFDASVLMPGYVKQGFSYVRSEIYARGKDKEILAMLFCRTSKFIEVPFGVIEGVGLTAINLVGALFCKGCSKNLNAYVFTSVAKNLVIGACLALTWHYTLLKILVVIGQIYWINTELKNIGKLYSNELQDFYEVKAMRKHGNENIKNLQLFGKKLDYQLLFLRSQTDVETEAKATLEQWTEEKRRKAEENRQKAIENDRLLNET